MRRVKMALPILALTVLASGVGSTEDARPFADLLLDVADVRVGMTVADVGAGRGDFAFRLAGAVGPAGRVYANEISQDSLALIERGRQERNLGNLTVVRGDETNPRLPGPVDRITMIDVYHHLAKPAEFLATLLKYLNPGGRLIIAAVVNKRNPEAKPSTSNTHDPCVSDPEETRNAIEQAGFVFETLVLHVDPARSYFWPTSYALVFRVTGAHPESDDQDGRDGQPRAPAASSVSLAVPFAQAFPRAHGGAARHTGGRVVRLLCASSGALPAGGLATWGQM